MNTYHVTATRQGRVWMLRCDELPTMFSESVRLDRAAEICREAIAFVADVPEDSFHIEVRPILPEAYDLEVARARRARELAASANAEAAEHSRAAARELAAAGLTTRDIGAVMGISHQRSAQLLAA